MRKQYNTHGSKQNLIACYVLFYVFLNWDLWVDDYVAHKGDSQNITFNLVQFQVDILGVFFDGFKICFQKSGSVSELIVLKIIAKKVIAVSLQKLYDVSGDQTIVKMKKKNQIIVIVMMLGRPEFINDRNLERRFMGFWEDSAVRSSKNFARGIPMLGIETGSWWWKRQILTTRPHGMSIV